MPAATRTAVDRFERLHSVTRAVLRLFSAGDWTPERGRTVEAALRALLLAWPEDRSSQDDEAIMALLEHLDATDLFEPAVVVDRGPFVERLLSLRDRSMLEAADRKPGWRPAAWQARGARHTDEAQSSEEQRLAGLLSRAFTRLYRSNMTLDDHSIVSITDRHGTIIDVNAAFCRISGYAREELLGAKHSILKSGRHPPAFYRELWHAIASGRIWTGEICNRRKDGTYYWVRSTIIPMPGPNGEPQHYVSVRTEITADKLADERLALLERAVLACSSGVVIADALRPELPLSYVSPSFARLFEQDESALLDTSLRELLAEGQPAETFDEIETLLNSTDGGSVLLRGTHADGSARVLDVRLSPVLHAEVVTHVVAVVSDVTELAATRSELRDREERLRRSEAAAGFGTWDNDIATGRLHWSAHVAALFGLSPGETETTYERFLAAVHPHDRNRVIEAADACIRLDKPYEIEHRCVWPDGTLRWVHESGHVVRDERGRPTRMIGVVQDITERKRLAAELQHERERLARTQALTRLGDWRVDDANDEAWWSAALYRIYRRDPSSFRPRPDTFVLAADTRDANLLEEALESARQGRETDCLHRIALPDGERRWVRLLAQPKRDSIGTVVALEGTVHDVTDTMQGEDCTRLLRRLLAMGERAVAIADRHGELVYANRTWRRTLGHEPGRRPAGPLLGACEAPLREALAREVQRCDPNFHHRGDLPMRRLDGTRFIARGEIAVSHDARGGVRYFVHQFRDAEGELKLEQALAAARIELERMREAGVRHAARTSEALHGPSQSVLAFAQMLSAQAGLSGTAQQYAQHVLDAGRRTLQVAGDMLDLVRAEAGRLSYRIEAVALERVFAELRSSALSGAPIRMHVSGAPESVLFVHCDPLRLVQALRALLRGAPQPLHVEAGIALLPADEARPDAGNRIEIRIAGARTRDETEDGAVHLARVLLARMGGTIELHPGAPGAQSGATDGSEGTARPETLVLRLPPAPPAAYPATPGAPASGTESPGVDLAWLERRTVLHIDDDCTGFSLLPVFRGDPRVRLLLSPSALLGIELARSKRPDVVLLDLDSGGIEAFGALRELRVDPDTCGIPVIALTADVSELNLRRIDACGVFRFVEKPLSLSELLRTIDAAFAVRRPTR